MTTRMIRSYIYERNIEHLTIHLCLPIRRPKWPGWSIRSVRWHKTIADTTILHSLQPYFIVNDTFGMHRIRQRKFSSEDHRTDCFSNYTAVQLISNYSDKSTRLSTFARNIWHRKLVVSDHIRAVQF